MNLKNAKIQTLQNLTFKYLQNHISGSKKSVIGGINREITAIK